MAIENTHSHLDEIQEELRQAETVDNLRSMYKTYKETYGNVYLTPNITFDSSGAICNRRITLKYGNTVLLRENWWRIRGNLSKVLDKAAARLDLIKDDLLIRPEYVLRAFKDPEVVSNFVRTYPAAKIAEEARRLTPFTRGLYSALFMRLLPDKTFEVMNTRMQIGAGILVLVSPEVHTVFFEAIGIEGQRAIAHIPLTSDHHPMDALNAIT